MRILYILISFIFFVFQIGSGQSEPSDSSRLDEIVISANKVEQKRVDVAQQISIIKSDYIAAQSPLNSADLLQSSGEVFVQKSQQGGGSPVIRGFEASRILLVVDGVRMNNLIYRAGHLQNLITLDPNVMDRVEIFNGPGSTMYGSDALGGVIHFRTKNPKFGIGGTSNNFGSASTSYHTVNQGANINVTYNLGYKNFASFTAVTLTRLGDLKMGGTKNPYNDNGYFGERPFYADRVDGKDVLVPNENKLVQKFSGYDQLDILQKFAFKTSESVQHGLNIQYSNSTNIPRYDRLTDPKGTGLNSAEWYYGPQKRLLAIYNLNFKLDGFFSTLDIAASYQNVQESRHNRGFGSSTLNHRVEDVQVAGFQIAAVRNAGKHQLRTGIDAYWNDLKSTAQKENINTGDLAALDTRYPDGKNSLVNAAGYVTHTFRLSDHFILNDGIRLGINNLFSTFVNKTFFPFPYSEVKQNNFVYSGNLGLIYTNRGFKASYMASLGYRAPNVDDIAKVFESAPGKLIVPNPDIKPETTFNNEVSLGYFDKSWSFENVVFYTSLSNFISQSPGTFDGQSSILYNGTLSQVLTTVNKAKGYIYGLYSGLRKQIGDHWGVYGSVTYTYGRSKTEDVTTPLDHISPLIAKFGVDARYSKADASFYVLYNGKKDLADYSPSGEDNLQYAPATGMPAWMTFNVRGGFKIAESLKILAGVENILDVQYRYFASGINAPGRNIWGSLRVAF